MRIQVFVKNNKAVGWGEGNAHYKANDCETVFIDISNAEYQKLMNGYDIVFDAQGYKVVESERSKNLKAEKLRIIELLEELENKFKNNVKFENADISKIVELLLGLYGKKF